MPWDWACCRETEWEQPMVLHLLLLWRYTHSLLLPTWR